MEKDFISNNERKNYVSSRLGIYFRLKYGYCKFGDSFWKPYCLMVIVFWIYLFKWIRYTKQLFKWYSISPNKNAGALYKTPRGAFLFKKKKSFYPQNDLFWGSFCTQNYYPVLFWPILANFMCFLKRNRKIWNFEKKNCFGPC